MASAKRAAVFGAVGSMRPERSAHDLSHRKLATDDMGRLIPITNFTAIPGDTLTISNEVVIRFQPCYAPILHEVNVYCHWWFVPWRIIWDKWEDYITGGRSGNFTANLPLCRATADTSGNQFDGKLDSAPGELFDYLYGVAVRPVGNIAFAPEMGNAPFAFPLYAYNKIYNDNYRDENLIDAVPLYDNLLKYRAWEKDYFTSALPDQQRGQAPGFPLSGSVSALFNGSAIVGAAGSYPGELALRYADAGGATSSLAFPVANNGSLNSGDAFKSWLSQNSINLQSVPTFDVADVRDAFQLQKYLERNMRAGARYTEWLRARYGVAPRDERLDRPEYIGGSKSPLIVSEVLQTSQTDSTPQANMAGHGITADRTFIGKYHVKEFGTVMCILSVMPRSMYQQGISKEFIKRSKYEFPIPEFAHTSERAIEMVELYADYSSAPASAYENNTEIFGYTGMYDEYRYLSSRVHGDFRDLLYYWHLGRQFANRPYLNRSFIEVNPQSTKRIYNVQISRGLMIAFGAGIKAVRPLPFIAEPGLVDHF